MPGNASIAVFALFVGIMSFTVRIWLPVGWNFELLELQFPFFPQYISMFIIGIIAYRDNWFEGLPDIMGKLWLIITIILFLLFPVFIVLSGALEGNRSLFGGVSWQALFYAVWEQFLCVSIIISLAVLFRKLYNQQ